MPKHVIKTHRNTHSRQTSTSRTAACCTRSGVSPDGQNLPCPKRQKFGHRCSCRGPVASKSTGLWWVQGSGCAAGVRPMTFGALVAPYSAASRRPGANRRMHNPGPNEGGYLLENCPKFIAIYCPTILGIRVSPQKMWRSKGVHVALPPRIGADMPLSLNGMQGHGERDDALSSRDPGLKRSLSCSGLFLTTHEQDI